MMVKGEEPCCCVRRAAVFLVAASQTPSLLNRSFGDRLWLI